MTQEDGDFNRNGDDFLSLFSSKEVKGERGKCYKNPI
jgi:hypothetical protein